MSVIMNYPLTSRLDYENRRQVFQTLNTIREMVKSDILRNYGFRTIKLIKPEMLDFKNRVFFYYIKSRYYFFLHKTHGRFSDLREANTYIDKMIASAREGKVILNSKRFFVRGHIKLLMAKESKNPKSKRFFLYKAKHLVESSLRYYPNESSFRWLEDQVDAEMETFTKNHESVLKERRIDLKGLLGNWAKNFRTNKSKNK